MQKLPVLIPFDNQFEDTHTWNQNYIFEFIFSANVDAVNMNDAFVLAFCVKLTAKLQILVVVTFLELAQLWVHWLGELICVTQQSFFGEFKMIKIVSKNDMDDSNWDAEYSEMLRNASFVMK